mmetsp:Transcript_15186/g.16890  ORF Transcript_15186/g.16890 Transcript_15186/m.16890 type:complete len:228 (+) Transcript_15186:159-842(+)
MSLSGQSGSSPSGGNTFETFTSGNTDGIDHFVLVENITDSDFLFQMVNTPFDLISDGSSVQLDFHKVSLLLSQLQQSLFVMDNNSDDGTVFFHLLETSLSFFLSINTLMLTSHFLGVVSESLLLALVPVLVESSLGFISDLRSPDSGQSSQTSGSFDVSNKTDDNHGRTFDDTDTLNNFLVVQFGTGTVDFSDDVSHTGLESEESGQMDGLGSVILGEGSAGTSMSS